MMIFFLTCETKDDILQNSIGIYIFAKDIFEIIFENLILKVFLF